MKLKLISAYLLCFFSMSASKDIHRKNVVYFQKDMPLKLDFDTKSSFARSRKQKYKNDIIIDSKNSNLTHLTVAIPMLFIVVALIKACQPRPVSFTQAVCISLIIMLSLSVVMYIIYKYISSQIHKSYEIRRMEDEARSMRSFKTKIVEKVSEAIKAPTENTEDKLDALQDILLNTSDFFDISKQCLEEIIDKETSKKLILRDGEIVNIKMYYNIIEKDLSHIILQQQSKVKEEIAKLEQVKRSDIVDEKNGDKAQLQLEASEIKNTFIGRMRAKMLYINKLSKTGDNWDNNLACIGRDFVDIAQSYLDFNFGLLNHYYHAQKPSRYMPPMFI